MDVNYRREWLKMMASPIFFLLIGGLAMLALAIWRVGHPQRTFPVPVILIAIGGLLCPLIGLWYGIFVAWRLLRPYPLFRFSESGVDVAVYSSRAVHLDWDEICCFYANTSQLDGKATRHLGIVPFVTANYAGKLKLLDRLHAELNKLCYGNMIVVGSFSLDASVDEIRQVVGDRVWFCDHLPSKMEISQYSDSRI